MAQITSPVLLDIFVQPLCPKLILVPINDTGHKISVANFIRLPENVFDMQVHAFNNSPNDSNVYLINGCVVVDVGMNARSTLEQIKQYTDPKNVELIVLTHNHYDHIGAVLEVASACNAKIAMHADDARVLNDDYATAAAMFGRKTPSFIPDIIYGNGVNETVCAGNDIFEVIHTPGHTKGCICLYNKASKVLFSGDTVFPSGSFGRYDLSGGNGKQLIESLKHLANLDVDIMYPGHGAVTDCDTNSQIKMSLQMAMATVRC